MYPASLKKTIICLEISKWLFIGIGLFLFAVWFPMLIYRIKLLNADIDVMSLVMEWTSKAEVFSSLLFIVVFFISVPTFIHFVIRGLKVGKYWCWIAALCIFIIEIPSFFLPLGAIGIYGLFHEDSRNYYKE